MKLYAIIFSALVLVNMALAADIVVDIDMAEMEESDMSGALLDRFEKFNVSSHIFTVICSQTLFILIKQSHSF